MNNFWKIIYKLLGIYRLWTKDNFGFNGLGGGMARVDDDWESWDDMQQNGQWESWLPPYEYQRFAWGDTMSCVTYSLLNCFETLLKRKYGEQWDFSDRFTAKVSGTNESGNSMYKVLESFRTIDGFLSWLFWNNETDSWSDFFAEIPNDKILLAKQNQKTFDIKSHLLEPTSPEKLKKALKKSPPWIAIYAYGKKENGVYQRIEGNMPNHAVMLEGYDEQGNWKIYDHYLGGEHRLLAKDYLIGYAMVFSITKK